MLRIFFAIIAITFLIGCNKPHPQPTNVEALTVDAWKLESALIYPAINYDNQEFTNVIESGIISRCNLDNLMYFYKDVNRFIIDDYKDLCSGSTINSYGNWYFNDDQSQLNIKPHLEVVKTFNIEQLDDQKLVLTYTGTIYSLYKTLFTDRNNYTFTITYSHNYPAE